MLDRPWPWGVWLTPFSGVRGEESSGPEPGELMEMSLDLIRQSLLLAASRTTPPVLYDGRYKSFNRFETKSYSKIASIGEVNINCNPHIFFHARLTLILTRFLPSHLSRVTTVVPAVGEVLNTSWTEVWTLFGYDILWYLAPANIAHINIIIKQRW